MSKVSKDLYLQLYSSSPAPKRDYHGLTITKDYITLNSWDISHGPHVFPRKLHTPIYELIDDIYLQNDIKNLFGVHVLEYAMKIAKGNIYTLNTLPHQIFLKILKCLAAQDIIHLGQTSKIFFELCNTNPVWKIIYRKKVRRSLSNQELSSAEKQTWRHLLKKKLNERISHIRTSIETKKPTKRDVEYLERYSNPVIHKKRPPPTDHVPKLDIDLDFITNEKKDSLKSKSLFSLPTKEKKTVRILTPKIEKDKNPFKTDSGGDLRNRLNTPRNVSNKIKTPDVSEKNKTVSTQNKITSSSSERFLKTIPSPPDKMLRTISSSSEKTLKTISSLKAISPSFPKTIQSNKTVSSDKMLKTASTPHLIDRSVLYKNVGAVTRQKSFSSSVSKSSKDFLKSEVKLLKTTTTRVADMKDEKKSSQKKKKL